MKKLMIAPAVLIGILILSSCKKDEGPNGENPSSSQCDSLIPSFSTDVFPIIERACSDENIGSCHQAGSIRGDYTGYEGIKIDANNGQIESRVVVSKSMPPGNSSGPTSLTNQELTTIECWLANGAPNN